MRIKEISVKNLFGMFDHVIPMNMDERITIIHGPNGVGKTILLKMLNSLFNSQYYFLDTIPFTEFRVDFDNHSYLVISESFVKNSKKSKRQLNFSHHQQGREVEKYIFPNLDLEDSIQKVMSNTIDSNNRDEILSLLQSRKNSDSLKLALALTTYMTLEPFLKERKKCR